MEDEFGDATYIEDMDEYEEYDVSDMEDSGDYEMSDMEDWEAMDSFDE